MKQDYWRIGLILLTCLFIGLIIDQAIVMLSIGGIATICWYISAIEKLRRWIHHQYEAGSPDLPGAINDIATEIDFIRSHYRHRDEKFTKFLRRYQQASEALPDAVIILGEDLQIEWANKKSQEYLGIYLPQDIGNRIVNLVRHPDLLEFISSSIVKGELKSKELQLTDERGLRLEFRITNFGKSHTLLVARDITQIHRTNQMRTDFIANASHELRTPLTVISGYLESLSDDMDSGENWSHQINQMQGQTTRMRVLIEDLLKLASLESADDLENMEVIQVPNMLNSIHEEANTISETQLFVSIETDQFLWIKGDRGQLYSAFSNLIFNAVQHSHERGVIIIRWYENEDGAIFEVQDFGDGIEPAHLPRLTERFYRVDKGRSRNKGGTGLGLAIVKHILANHGSKIEIESTVGEGSLFRCKFSKDLIVHKESDFNDSISA